MGTLEVLTLNAWGLLIVAKHRHQRMQQLAAVLQETSAVRWLSPLLLLMPRHTLRARGSP